MSSENAPASVVDQHGNAVIVTDENNNPLMISEPKDAAGRISHAPNTFIGYTYTPAEIPPMEITLSHNAYDFSRPIEIEKRNGETVIMPVRPAPTKTAAGRKRPISRGKNGGKEKKCPWCDFKCRCWTQLGHHARDSHPEVTTRQRNIVKPPHKRYMYCPLCDETPRGYREFRKHIDRAHPDYEYDDCDDYLVRNLE